MEPDFATTNVLLGIMAAVSVLEALAVIGLFLGAFLFYRRIVHVIDGIEERQVAPAAARVNAILDDIKDVTTTVKEEAGQAEWVVRRAMNALRRLRRKANA
jgi:outer membrane lipoprotein-sorting protein